MDKYQILLNVAKANYAAFADAPEDLQFASGLIAEGLHRMKPIHSGLVSELASVKGTKICKEHFFGRQKSALLIMKKIAEGRSDKFLYCLIKSRSRVHYTTAGENMNLIKYDNLHWRQAYEKAGVNLIPFTRRGDKYVYIIDGIVYNDNIVAEKFNLPIGVIKYRCMSKGKKWNGWKKEKAINE